MSVHRLAGPLFLLAAIIASTTAVRGQDPSPAAWLHDALTAASTPKPTIVLVDGVSADATNWKYIVPILQKDGYNVVAVENRLSSLSEDVATTKRVIDSANGRVVLVGHSYGGAVITGIAANPRIKALVYIAALAPDANEPIYGQTIAFPAWRSIRSWYLVSRDDQTINADLQRFFARRMRATTSEVQESRVAFISRPNTVAQLIEEAAAANRK